MTFRSVDCLRDMLGTENVKILQRCAPVIASHLDILEDVKRKILYLERENDGNNEVLHDVILSSEMWLKEESRRLQYDIFVDSKLRVCVHENRLADLDELRGFARYLDDFMDNFLHTRKQDASLIPNRITSFSEKQDASFAEKQDASLVECLGRIFSGEEPIPGCDWKRKIDHLQLETFLQICHKIVGQIDLPMKMLTMGVGFPK